MKNVKLLPDQTPKMPYLVKDNVAEIVTFSDEETVNPDKRSSDHGFSIIELLIVAVVIGIIATLAVPHLQKGIIAAENGNMRATMRTISSTQAAYFTQHSRFGRLNEINTVLSGSIGTPSGDELIRGKFVLAMVPAAPSDEDLKAGYTITVTRDIAGEGVVYLYEITHAGEVRQILP
jgi:prepilin-type N-terminal cleavage/methylation domain-containing protein